MKPQQFSASSEVLIIERGLLDIATKTCIYFERASSPPAEQHIRFLRSTNAALYEHFHVLQNKTDDLQLRTLSARSCVAVQSYLAQLWQSRLRAAGSAMSIKRFLFTHLFRSTALSCTKHCMRLASTMSTIAMIETSFVSNCRV